MVVIVFVGKGIKRHPQHRSSSTFDGPMLLLDDVVQIPDLTNLDGCLALRVHRMQCRQVRTAFIDAPRLGRTVLSDCLFKETPGSNLVPLGSEQKIDGVTRLVYGTIQVFPRTFDLDIGFIHAPALAHRALVLALRNVFSNNRYCDRTSVPERGALALESVRQACQDRTPRTRQSRR